MRAITLLALAFVAVNANALDCASTDIDASQRRLLGAAENICENYGGNVLLVTNVASHCGFTPQYEGLENLYKEYKDDGLIVLGFPSGDFNDQEFESEEDIARFCKLNFGVSFPMFSRSSVKGDEANPLFKKLIAKTGEEPGWNFNKYLVGRDGKVIAHFGSKVEPNSPQLVNAIKQALTKEAR